MSECDSESSTKIFEPEIRPTFKYPVFDTIVDGPPVMEEWIPMNELDIENIDDEINELEMQNLEDNESDVENIDDETNENELDMQNLEDAVYAGTSRSQQCTLILTEGKSALSVAITGLTQLERKYYEAYGMKGGHIHNPRTERKDCSIVDKLCMILGLDKQKTYTTTSELQTLLYGKIATMFDRDNDGSIM